MIYNSIQIKYSGEFKEEEPKEDDNDDVDDLIEEQPKVTTQSNGVLKKLKLFINYEIFHDESENVYRIIFKDKLKEVSSEIGVGENSIIKLMKHESGLNPSIKNSIGCVGLIQFCPDSRGGNTKTIAGKTYNLSDLQNDLKLQMDAIKEFWSAGKRSGKIKNASDLYIYNFFPVAAGKDDNFILQTKGLSAKTVAKANPIFNRKLGKPIDSPLTVGDLKQYYKQTGMV